MSRPARATDEFVPASTPPTQFSTLDEGRYRLTMPGARVELEIDRLRRERDELFGELSVTCAIAGAKTINGGQLSIGTLNLSSPRARQDRAKLLALQSRADEIDWLSLLEEFAQRVLAAERAGQPAVLLHTFPRPSPDDTLDVEGVRLYRAHPVIVFGDGGTLKSYVALFLAGQLAARGLNVMLADWELAGSDHRERLEQIFGAEMPRIHYARCERPLCVEADRLRREARKHGVDFIVYDSVAYAADGPPEAAEVAMRYFRAVRHIGVGSLHIAHTNRSERSDEKPFGSTYWHNSARATWFVKREEDTGEPHCVRVGLFHKKVNIGALLPAVGFEVRFESARTVFRRINLATDGGDLASKLPLWQRIREAVRHQPLTIDALAARLEANRESIEKAFRRRQNVVFTRVSGEDGKPRIALVTGRSA